MVETEQRLRILIVEDSEDDALLVERELKRGGYLTEMQRVDTAEGMQKALERHPWDLIITDHNMPGFTSQEALALVKAFDPNIPFILVSGSIGEEIAVEAMRSGAHDYVLKGNLARLLPAIDRELREAENRRAHRAAEEKIRHMAFHDSLTGLINRGEFERRLVAAVSGAKDEGENHALLYIDLDQFKLVNDTCGHLAGDQLLIRVASRLQRRIRDSDTLARLGGDEFGVLLKNCRIDRAKQIATNLIETVNDFLFVWEERTFKVGMSIGLVDVGYGQDAQSLLRMSDMACYAAKDRGRNRVYAYSEGDAELSQRFGELDWLQRLNAAIAGDSLLLYQQHIQSLQGGPGHSEILLRMRGEDGELISAASFIPAAERYNLMPDVDRWVIRNTCDQLRRLGHSPQGDAAGAAVFINLSANSLSDPDLVAYIEEQLARHQLNPASIGFEITETATIADFDCALEMIAALRRSGFGVALDDFGTGMSSFSYLKALDIDYIKIDGSFVRTMLEDKMNCAIVEAINTIAGVAGIQAIAEFVETGPILDRLRDLGVAYAQGWAVHRPEPLIGD
jgi:diguanylate cyclase (GGDEF)-like protein